MPVFFQITEITKSNRVEEKQSRLESRFVSTNTIAHIAPNTYPLIEVFDDTFDAPQDTINQANQE